MGSRGIVLLILDVGARKEWVVSTTARPLYPRERPGTHCTRGWVGPRVGLDVCEKFHPHPDFFLSYFARVVYLLVWNCSGIRRKTERLRAVDFFIIKNPGANPLSWVPEASTQTPRPPKPLTGFDPRAVQPVVSRYID
jgi:hypothetical protein